MSGQKKVASIHMSINAASEDGDVIFTHAIAGLAAENTNGVCIGEDGLLHLEGRDGYWLALYALIVMMQTGGARVDGQPVTTDNPPPMIRTLLDAIEDMEYEDA